MRKIGITSRVIRNGNGNLSDSIEHAYLEYFSNLGFVPLIVPNNGFILKEYVNDLKLDGIVLSGGGDVSYSYQNRTILERDDDQKIRDEVEASLIQWAIAHNKPVFGICRGMQFINVFFGGKVSRDIKEELGYSHVGVNHFVQVVDEKFCSRERFEVNSYHNHGVFLKDLASQLTPFAIIDNRLVEGFYHQSLPIVAVQWHPERSITSQISVKIIESVFSDKEVWR